MECGAIWLALLLLGSPIKKRVVRSPSLYALVLVVSVDRTSPIRFESVSRMVGDNLSQQNLCENDLDQNNFGEENVGEENLNEDNLSRSAIMPF